MPFLTRLDSFPHSCDRKRKYIGLNNKSSVSKETMKALKKKKFFSTLKVPTYSSSISELVKQL